MGTYIDTFILVSPDTPAEYSQIPAAKKDSKPVHVIQYELLSQNPYKFTQDELIYEVHIRHKQISEEECDARGDAIWAELFQKPHPCLRTSTLAKRYGWGFHYNEEGRIALYPMESEQYRQFAESQDGKTQLVKAMRSSKTK